MKNLNNQQYIKTKEEVREQTVAIQNSSLLEVKGLGPKTVATLMEHWIETVDDLRATSLDNLFKIIKNPIAKKQIEDFLGVGA